MTIDQMMKLFQLYFAGMEEEQLYITRAIFQSPEYLREMIESLDKRILYLENLNMMRAKADAKRASTPEKLYERLHRVEMEHPAADGQDLETEGQI